MQIDAQELLLLRLEAMRSVLRKDAEYWLRYICRWYSEHYSTPLHMVGTPDGCVSLAEACRTFYEVYYRDLNDADREAEIGLLTSTPEELRQQELQKDITEAENWQFARNVEKNLRAKEARERAKAEKQRLEQVKLREQNPMAVASPPVPKSMTPPVVPGKPMPEPVLPEGPPALAALQVPQRPMDTPRAPAPKGTQGGSFDIDPFTAEGKDPPLVKTQLPPDVKVVFMTDEEMARDMNAQDPFSVTKPESAKPRRRKPPQSKK